MTFAPCGQCRQGRFSGAVLAAKRSALDDIFGVRTRPRAEAGKASW
jgi:hypothetical protein